MADWGTLANVQARVTYKTVDGSSSPTSTQVTSWVEEGEALLKATFQALEFPTSYSNTNVVRWLGKLVEDYAEGRLRMAWASADGTGANTDGQDLITAFNDRIEDMFANPAKYGQLLGVGTSPESGIRIKSYVTDNADSKTVANGDFEPKIDTDEVF